MPQRFRNLTAAQEHAFELIAINQRPNCTPRTLAALVALGLITKHQRPIYGRGNSPIDRIPMLVDEYEVPLPIHAEWCTWCDEHYTDEELTIKGGDA